MSLHHGLRSAAGASVADPDFKNVSLLLLGNGSNGGQNNSFVDDSSNAFSITRYGNTTQGTFSPFGYNWSNYFDGTGDYLSVASNSAFAFGTGDFTVECWFYPTSSDSSQTLFILDATGGFALVFEPDGSNVPSLKMVRRATTASAGDLVASYTIIPNKWIHVAAARSGSTVSLFIDGSRVATGTSSINYTVNGPVNIGTISTVSGYEAIGNISNLRVVKGTAVYDPTQTTLTVPTAPLTAITNTSLLTCQSNRFLDNSSNAFTITPYGNAAVTNFAPFPTNTEYSTGTNGGSGYFDGSGDYLTAPAGSSYDFGSGNFTVECWVYTTTSSGNAGIVGVWGTSTAKSWILYRLGTTWQFYYDGPSGSPVSASVSVATNTWVHLAVVRNGSTITIYVDGTSAGSNNVGTTSLTQSLSQSLAIGANLDTGPTNYFTGFISSLRILKGTAQYTANFTPSTTPLTAITNTSLLLNFTNGSIIDSTGKNNLETVGDAQISTATKKYGTGSMKFDGTGDWLAAPESDLFAFGTGDFTIEFWLYASSFSNSPTILDTRANNSSSTGFSDYFGTNGKYNLYLGNSTVYTSNTALSTTTWYHIAICRNGTSLRVFINGTQDGSTVTNSTNLSDKKCFIGNNLANTGAFNGNLDDLRITKGVARYTANFTAPTRQLPAR